MSPKFKKHQIVNAMTLGQEPFMVIEVHENDSGVHRYDLQSREGVDYANIGEYEIRLAPLLANGGGN